jgi:outer membrane protein OmpA-like peptidoglycan-associated protein
MFKVPLSTNAFDIGHVGIFQVLTDKSERKYPIFLLSTRGCKQKEIVTLPAGYAVKGIPDAVRITDGPVSLTITTALDGDKVLFTSDFRIEKSVLDPAEYKSLRRVAMALKRFQKAMVILEKKEGAALGGGR